MSAIKSRGDVTRARILAVAGRQFADEGYERATIRTVAAAAGTDPALVMRYFGSKDGLFAAATEFDLRLPDLGRAERDHAGETLVRHFLWRWEGDPADQSLRILLRAGVTHAEATARIRSLFTEQVAPAIRAVAPDRPELRASLIASQIIGLALCRFILFLPPLAGMTREDVIACVGPNLQRYLTGPIHTTCRS